MLIKFIMENTISQKNDKTKWRRKEMDVNVLDQSDKYTGGPKLTTMIKNMGKFI